MFYANIRAKHVTRW